MRLFIGAEANGHEGYLMPCAYCGAKPSTSPRSIDDEYCSPCHKAGRHYEVVHFNWWNYRQGVIADALERGANPEERPAKTAIYDDHNAKMRAAEYVIQTYLTPHGF